jgi:hypothetical protein
MKTTKVVKTTENILAQQGKTSEHKDSCLLGYNTVSQVINGDYSWWLAEK